MKKLLLILPRNDRGYWGKVSSKGKTGFLRLSLPAVAAITPPDWDVTILDARATPIDYDQKIDLVGITAFTAEIPHAYEIADRFRLKGIPVVMGGIHVSALPHEALFHADSVVVGEAEPVWATLLEDLINKRLKRIYRADDLIDMKNMTVPSRHLIDRSMYVSCFHTIQASRGCPFHCNYCAVTSFFGNKYRTRPVSEVIDEIKQFDTRDFFFVDDNIIGQPAYARDLFKALIPLKRVWGGQTTINLAKNDELLSLFAKSGGKYTFIGFESLSLKNLANVNKSWNTPDNYRYAIKKIHKAGINIAGSFIFGLDDDDPDVFERTVDFIMENNIDAAQFHILTPFPGTELYERMKDEDRITDRNWAKYHTGEVIFEPRSMTAEQLQQGYYRAFHKTYTPLNILRRCLRSPKNFTFRVGLNLTYLKKAVRMPKPI